MRSSSKSRVAAIAVSAALALPAAPAQAATVGQGDGVCTVTITQRDVDAHATWENAGAYPAAGEQFLITPGTAPVPEPGLDGYDAARQAQEQGLYEACDSGQSGNVTLARSDGRGVLPPNPLEGSSVEGGIALVVVTAIAAAVGFFWPQISAYLP